MKDGSVNSHSSSEPDFGEEEIDIIQSVVGALDEEDDDEEDEDNHETWVEINFPREVDMLYHVASIALPISGILTWMAEHLEDRPERFLAIRDDFYDDDDRDEIDICDEYQLYDREELARLRIDRRSKKMKREERRKEFPPSEATVISKSSPEDRWGAHLAEGMALEAELNDHWARCDELDRKWEEFLEKSSHQGRTSGNWIEVRRSELVLEGSQLDLEYRVLMARSSELDALIWSEEEKRSAS